MKDLENSVTHILGSVTAPFLVPGEIKIKMCVLSSKHIHGRLYSEFPIRQRLPELPP